MTDMPTGPHAIQIFFKQRWPILLLVVALLAAVLVFHNDLANPSAVRTWIVFILAAGVVYAANKRFFPQNAQSDDPLSVRYVIAFDSVVFIIVGLSATVLACSHWEAALLLSGASLMIGGFFGLLFGYPQGVAQQSKGQAGQADQQAPNRDKTLLADSAATLGKVITGFTLAKLGTVSAQFGNLCKIIGPVLGAQDAVAAQVLAGVIVAYFLATGFFSGLLLPSYFMSDRF
jgi:uncharacterized membrane protein YtjA (UPF0391 family)